MKVNRKLMKIWVPKFATFYKEVIAMKKPVSACSIPSRVCNRLDFTLGRD